MFAKSNYIEVKTLLILVLEKCWNLHSRKIGIFCPFAVCTLAWGYRNQVIVLHPWCSVLNVGLRHLLLPLPCFVLSCAVHTFKCQDSGSGQPSGQHRLYRDSVVWKYTPWKSKSQLLVLGGRKLSFPKFHRLSSTKGPGSLRLFFL